MIRPTLRLTAVALVLAVGAGLGPTAPAAAICSFDGINGTWRANDGGTYRVRQTGNRVQWIGLSGDSGRSWAHQFRGTRSGDIITGNWADFRGPMGRGTMTVRVRNVMHMVRVSNSGSGFGGSRWWRTCNDVEGRPG